jgi:16S rRNA (uracil1498-N3)-methyltransferase
VPHFFAARDGGRVRLTGEDAAHLARSLRARSGQRIRVVEPGDGQVGSLLVVRLVAVSPSLVEGEVEEERPHQPEPLARVTMALSLLPSSALEEALARCTELGASGFVLIGARRSVARDVAPRKAARWASICREAAMLAGRLVVPEVRGPVALESLGSGEEVVVLDAGGSRRLAEVREPRDVTLAIGPEGGWAPEELEWAVERTATLGPRNLRAENAAAAALAVALAGRGDI